MFCGVRALLPFAYLLGICLASVYNNSVVLDSSNNFVMKWNLNGTTSVDFSMSARADGWISIGFAPSMFTMTGKMAIGWISNDQTTLNLYSAIGTAVPSYVKPIPVTASSYANGVTTIEFTLSLADSGINLGGDQAVNWALSSSDPGSYTLQSMNKHSAKGSVSVTFSQNNNQASDGLQQLDCDSSPVINASLYSNKFDSLSRFKLYGRYLTGGPSMSDSLVEFAVETSFAGWAGFGFCGSSCGMTNTDMIIGVIQNDVLTYGDFWSVGEVQPRLDTARGGVSDVIATKCYQNPSNGRTQYVFQRKANTGDSSDRSFRLDQNTRMVWAGHVTSKQLSTQHGGSYTGSFTLAGNSNAGAPDNSSGGKVATLIPEDYPVKITFDPDFKIYIKKHKNYTNENPLIQYALDVNAVGYVALGFADESMSMSNADVVVASVSSTGVLTINDYYSFGQSTPQLDTTLGESKNVIPINGYEENGRTKVIFAKSAKAGDQYDRMVDFNKTTYWIYAWHPTVDSLIQHDGNTKGSFPLAPVNLDNPSLPGDGGGEMPYQDTGLYDTSKYSLKYTSDPNFLIFGRVLPNQGENGTMVEFVLDVKATGWVGIGFGSNNMVNSDMVIASVSNGNVLSIDDYWSSGEFTPQLDTSLGGKSNVFGVFANEDPGTGRTVVIFRKKSVADGIGDADIFTNGEMNSVIYAYHPTSDALVSHPRNSRKSVSFSLTGTVSSSSSDDLIYSIHGALMSIAWALIVPITVIYAKYYKHIGHKWFLIHQWANVVSITITIAMGVLVFAAKSPSTSFSNPDPAVVAHASIGLIVMVVSFGQGIIGKVADLLWKPDRQSVPVFPDMVHAWIGRILFTLGIANIGLGIYSYDLNAGWWAFYGIVVAGILSTFVYHSQTKSTEHGASHKSSG
ncbi:hypothetical protein MP638_005535 [Amoeboaphelidium occidentale]|nr:hypothetical protein MP638_005535 [Amoeboaphelidium occidentale]